MMKSAELRSVGAMLVITPLVFVCILIINALVGQLDWYPLDSHSGIRGATLFVLTAWPLIVVILLTSRPRFGIPALLFFLSIVGLTVLFELIRLRIFPNVAITFVTISTIYRGRLADCSGRTLSLKKSS